MQHFSLFSRLLRVLPAFIAAAIFMGCSRHEPDQRLVAAEALIYEDPKEAMVDLRMIDADRLGNADRHLYDLLTIKAADKAFVVHTSDTLILPTIDYFKTHGPQGRYAEALYYGGRVYRDLGDAPTALDYFQRSLDNLPKDSINSDFEANLLSQTALLLGRMELLEESIPYLERTIRMDDMLHDTINKFRDLRSLGEIYYHLKDFENAEKYFLKAKNLKGNIPLSQTSANDIYLANLLIKRGETDSAIAIVKNALPYVSEASRPTAMAYAAKIYLEGGEYDSAYVTAKRMLDLPDNYQNSYTYFLLLSPELRGFSTKDTLLEYIENYRSLLQESLNENQSRLVVNSQSLYNYKIHQKEKEAAAERSRVLMWMAAVSLIVLLVLAIIVLYLKYRNKNNLLELAKALANVQMLREIVEKREENRQIQKEEEKQTVEETTKNTDGIEDPEPEIHPKIIMEHESELLRDKLKQEYLHLAKITPKVKLPETVKESDLYKKLLQRAKARQLLPEKSPYWDEIENLIFSQSPDFVKNMELLSNKKINRQELRTAFLIKLEFTNSDMAVLLGNSPNTITSRRHSMSLKMFDSKLGLEIIDKIIRIM